MSRVSFVPWVDCYRSFIGLIGAKQISQVPQQVDSFPAEDKGRTLIFINVVLLNWFLSLAED